MPELPEVETVMRGLAPVLEGQEIQQVTCGSKRLRIPFPKGLEDRLKGKKIQNLYRRAKYILCDLEDHNILAIHLGMSGRIRILAPQANSEPELHDHFELILKDGHKIILNDARRFGMVFDIPDGSLHSHKAFAHLGPEPLLEDFDADYLYKCLSKKTSPIKVAIMDQRVVVGVGNIYACEALYRANISPKTKSSSVSRKKLETLITHIKEVLQDAIKAGGSTLKDHKLPDGEFGYFQQKHSVYGREGKECPTQGCGESIERIVQTGRSTFFCNKCQAS